MDIESVCNFKLKRKLKFRVVHKIFNELDELENMTNCDNCSENLRN